MHLNGIDYNEALDQITFSSLKFNEIYVIDHSTKTSQAAATQEAIRAWRRHSLPLGNPEAYGARHSRLCVGNRRPLGDIRQYLLPQY